MVLLSWRAGRCRRPCASAAAGGDGGPAQAVRRAPDARAEAVAQGALPHHHARAAKLQLLHLRAHGQSMPTPFQCIKARAACCMRRLAVRCLHVKSPDPYDLLQPPANAARCGRGPRSSLRCGRGPTRSAPRRWSLQLTCSWCSCTAWSRTAPPPTRTWHGAARARRRAGHACCALRAFATDPARLGNPPGQPPVAARTCAAAAGRRRQAVSAAAAAPRASPSAEPLTAQGCSAVDRARLHSARLPLAQLQDTPSTEPSRSSCAWVARQLRTSPRAPQTPGMPDLS